MYLHFDLSILPLLFIPIIFTMLTLLAYTVWKTTNIKKDFQLSIAFCIIALFSISIYTYLDESKISFWGKPYQLASLCLILMITATTILEKKANKNEIIVETILSILFFVALLVDDFFAGQIVFFSFLINGIWLVYNGIKYHDDYTFRGIALFLLAIFLFVGQWFPFYSGIFLFSILIIVSLLIESCYYFLRVANLMRNAGINSIKDPLTNLFNKGYLIRKIGQLLKNEDNVSLIFIDIDNFKKLNDTKGHDYGDEILIKVGATLKMKLENKGYACRFGGEEMVGIVIDGDSTQIAESVRKKVEESLGVTISVGVASSNEIEEPNALSLLKEADKRMYVAKTTGKNRVVSSDNE